MARFRFRSTKTTELPNSPVYTARLKLILEMFKGWKLCTENLIDSIPIVSHVDSHIDALFSHFRHSGLRSSVM